MSERPSDAESIRSDLKIIVIGSSGTGKTSYVNKWTKNIFQEEYKATIVSEFGFKVFEHEGKLYRIQLWDLGGQDKNSTITKIFAKDSHGCIIVADALRPQNLEETLKWKNAVDEAVTFYDDGQLPAVLVQNKVDLLPEEEQDNVEELKKFSEENGFNGYFRASAKTGKNISESMEFLIKEIIKRLEEINSKGNADFNKDRGSVALDPDKHNKEADLKRKNETSGCC